MRPTETTEAGVKPSASEIEIELPFSGFYESEHGSQIDRAIEIPFSDDQGYVTPEKGDAIWSADINNKAIEIEYSKAYVIAFGQQYGLDLRFAALQSPKYYNFSTDRIFAIVPIEQINAIRKAVEQHEKWPEYIKKQFTAADGWMPFYDADSSSSDWTAEPLDVSQYRVILEFWIEYIYAGVSDSLFHLMYEIEPYEFESVADAHDVIRAYIKKKGGKHVK